MKTDKYNEIRSYLALFDDYESLFILNLFLYSGDTSAFLTFYSEHLAEIHCRSTTFLIKRNGLFKDLPTLLLNHRRQIRFTKVDI